MPCMFPRQQSGRESEALRGGTVPGPGLAGETGRRVCRSFVNWRWQLPERRRVCTRLLQDTWEASWCLCCSRHWGSPLQWMGSLSLTLQRKQKHRKTKPFQSRGQVCVSSGGHVCGCHPQEGISSGNFHFLACHYYLFVCLCLFLSRSYSEDQVGLKLLISLPASSMITDRHVSLTTPSS